MNCKKCGRPMGKKNYCSVCDKGFAQRAREKEQQKKKKMKLLWIALGCVLAVALALVLIFAIPWGGSDVVDGTLTSSNNGSTPTTTGGDTDGSGETPDISGKHHVAIEIQDYGIITLELDADVAPITVDNFLTLAEAGFYDGLTFHRIMEGFMMQGGDPLGTGIGGSNKTIKGEFSANGVENSISHVRGVISMARSSSYDSASSQFFIVHQDSTFLDGQYAAFGHVTEGMDVVDAICEYSTSVVTDSNGTVPADKQPVIVSVTVID